MSYRHLTPDERNVIWQMRRLGKGRAEIARCLGRHRSTVSRELRRNAGFECAGVRGRGSGDTRLNSWLTGA